MLGILAGAQSRWCTVLGGQAGALLQFCQQSICTETPGSGPTATSCPPCGLVPLPKSQEQKECHSRSCCPAASAPRGPEHPPRDPHPSAGCAHLPKEWRKGSCPRTPAKKPLPVLSLTQHKPWQGKAHPGPILRAQSTTSPKEGRALFLSAFVSLPWLSLTLGNGERSQQSGCFPDPGSPAPGQGWLPAPTGCSGDCGAAAARFLFSNSLHFRPSARLTTGPIGPLGWGRHRREQGPMAAPLQHPLPLLR